MPTNQPSCQSDVLIVPDSDAGFAVQPTGRTHAGNAAMLVRRDDESSCLVVRDDHREARREIGGRSARVGRAGERGERG